MASKLASVPLVCVIWDDAWGREAGEFTVAEIASDLHHPSTIHTFGLIVYEDEGGIMVAQEITTPDEDGDPKYRGLGFIPRGMIKEVVELGVPKRKVKKAPKVSLQSPETVQEQ